MKSQTVDELERDVEDVCTKTTQILEEGLRRCLPIVKDGIRFNFDSATDPDGVGWPARSVQGDGHPLLVDTGQLRDAATGGHIADVDGDTLRVGVDKGGGGGGIPGAAVHNYGFGKIPKREYLGLREEFIEKCQEQLTNAMMEHLV
jgi:phage gpG-like protein